MSSPKFSRILLKLSGEYLAGPKGTGLNPEVLANTAKVLKKAKALGTDIAIVVGGGNYWRGRSSEAMDRVTADQIGMLATTMNALALADACNTQGIETSVMSSVYIESILPRYSVKSARKLLNQGKLLIFAAGTGSPFFSTDTAAALRAAEIEADALFKATNVDGIYDSDPKTNPNAKRFDQITHSEVLTKNLKVMDATAAALCRDNTLPIMVFDIKNPENLIAALNGEAVGTLVH